MLKHLHRYPWILLAIALGAILCVAVMLHMLLPRIDAPREIFPGAQLVREAVHHAAI